MKLKLNNPFKPDSKATNPKDAVGSGKIPVHLWPASATVLGAMGLLDGMLKYGRMNWRPSGVRFSIYYDAIMRHTFALIEGEWLDPDSSLPHLCHILACAAIVGDAQAAGVLNDDRNYPGGYRELVDQLTPEVERLKEKYNDRSPHHFSISDYDTVDRRRSERVYLNADEFGAAIGAKRPTVRPVVRDGAPLDPEPPADISRYYRAPGFDEAGTTEESRAWLSGLPDMPRPSAEAAAPAEDAGPVVVGAHPDDGPVGVRPEPRIPESPDGSAISGDGEAAPPRQLADDGIGDTRYATDTGGCYCNIAPAPHEVHMRRQNLEADMPEFSPYRINEQGLMVDVDPGAATAS